LRTVRAGLAAGPVLIQVPRRGYLAMIACGRCRAAARCLACGGPLQVPGAHEVPGCAWCGALAGGWQCPRCGSGQVRAAVVGAARTAEELGRAFPGVQVRTSGGSRVLPRVPDDPALVIATPGAEPLGRYAAALLLDGWALLARPSLRSEEEALRRWMAAAALVRPGGAVLVHADASLPVVQALIRWDPGNFAERALADRVSLALPPAVRMAAVTGDADAVASLLAAIPPLAAGGAPAATRQPEVLGPAPVELAGPPAEAVACQGGSPLPGEAASAPPGPHPPGPARAATTGAGADRAREGPAAGADGRREQVRALLRVPRADGLALARALHAAQAVRSARKEGGGVRVQLDPAELT
jgi:primosomal protein N' (replication factor Y) (superfamily II helicase)